MYEAETFADVDKRTIEVLTVKLALVAPGNIMLEGT